MSDPTNVGPTGSPPGPGAGGPPSGPPRMPTGPGAPVPSGPPPSDEGGRSWATIAVVALVLLAFVGGGVAAYLAFGSDDDGDDSAGADEEFVLEPVSFSGDNPFMDPVGTDEAQVDPPDQVGGSFEGDTEGLYGGTLDTASCDAEQLVEFLEANPAEAQAWADVHGITVDRIADFVDGLTPVVLRSDTAVTNHGFTDGVANPIPAVLQAGTAVMVDEFGVPRVKCYCGNPLLPPPPRTTSTVYRGQEWTGYRETEVTVVEETTVEIDVFVVVDVETGEPFSRPAGTDGSEDGPAPGEEPPETTTTTTTAPESDDGRYEGTYSGDCGGGQTSQPITATVQGGTVTIMGGGDSISAPLQADGSFSTTFEGATITGRVANGTLEAQVQQAGCSGLRMEATKVG